MKEKSLLPSTNSKLLLSGLIVLVGCSFGGGPAETSRNGQRESHVLVQEDQNFEILSSSASNGGTPMDSESDPTDAVTKAITTSWGMFRSGVDDLVDKSSTRCRGLPHYQRNLRAEMKNLRGGLEAEFGDISQISMQVIAVTQSGVNQAEAVTRLFHSEEPLSHPGTQRLVFEDGGWKLDDCDERELKISFECGEAFGEEHRHDCMSFWHDVVVPSGCDLQNPDFVQEFADAVYGPNPPRTEQEWRQFSRTCSRESDKSNLTGSRHNEDTDVT